MPFSRVKAKQRVDPNSKHLYNVFNMGNFIPTSILPLTQRAVLTRHSMRVAVRGGVTRPRMAGDYYELLVRVGSAEVGGPRLALPVSNNELAHLIWTAESSRRAIISNTFRRKKRQRARIKSKALDIIDALRRKATKPL